MRVHHLNCGTMCPRPAALINGVTSPAGQGHGRPSLAATVGGFFARARLVCHCLAIELPSGLALVDTGLGTADVADPKRRLGAGFLALAAPVCRYEETALAQLAQLGFKRDDVRHILPTHLDLDHAGGIADFPDATVHLLTRELNAANARITENERQRYRPAQWAGARLQKHEPRGEKWFGFEAVRALPGSKDDVLIIPLYGHTRGHAGIAVRVAGGWLLHAGDAYFHHREVHASPPSCPLGLSLFQRALEVDGDRRRHNRDRLHELASTHGHEVTVVCAHDPSEYDALASRTVQPSPQREHGRV